MSYLKLLCIGIILAFVFQSDLRFVLHSGAAVVQDGAGSRGSSWGDIDGDGDEDLFVTNHQNQDNLLYLNKTEDPSKPILEPVVESVVVSNGGDSQGSSFGDYDNDGDLDLFVGNRRNQKNFLYRNKGNGTFEKITSGAIANDTLSSTSVSWVDANNDRYLDLFVASRNDQPNALYINSGEGTFEKLNTGIIVEDLENSRTCVWGDFDNDGDQDLFVGNARQNNTLYINEGDLSFTRLTEGDLVQDGGYTYGVSTADVNNDGLLDLFVSNLSGPNHLYINHGNLKFSKETEAPLVIDEGDSKGHVWQDFDNDGDLDLFISNGTPGSFEDHFYYENSGNGSFSKLTDTEITKHGGMAAGSSSSDVNSDGRMDLFVTNWVDNANNNLFLNLSDTTEANWIQLDLLGTESPKTPYGSRAAVYYSVKGESKVSYQTLTSQSGYGSQSSLVLHFGIGQATMVDSVSVKWTSGIRQVLTALKTNSKQQIVESNN